MRFQTLLFDVDDTLLDFQAAQKNALKQLLSDEGVQLTPVIEANYIEINTKLWHLFELGKMGKEAIGTTRFKELFTSLGKTVDEKEVDQRYRKYLGQGYQLLGDSKKIIEKLAKNHDLFIVTNGAEKIQYPRLEKSGLLPYFKDIFISETIGYQKPMKEYFDYVFDHIPNFSRKQTLLIGDSLHADIQGGNSEKIQTAWLKPQAFINSTEIQPSYEIQKLEELLPIVIKN